MIAKFLKITIFAFIGIILLFVSIVGYLLRSNHYDWRQKLTVSIETPDGPRTASTVQEISISSRVNKSAGMPNSTGRTIFGEAVVIPVSQDRYIFALLRGTRILRRQNRNGISDVSNILVSIFSENHNMSFPALLGALDTLPAGSSYIVPKKLYPLFVTFEDIDEPNSIRLVDPDDLDATFGCNKNTGVKLWRELGLTYEDWLAEVAKESDEYKSMRSRRVYSGLELEKIIERSYVPRDTSGDCYSLKSLKLEITDEPVTMGKIETLLRWFGAHKGWLVLQNLGYDNVTISSRDFNSEVFK